MLQAQHFGDFFTRLEAEAKARHGTVITRRDLAVACGRTPLFSSRLFANKIKEKLPEEIIAALVASYQMTPERAAHLNRLNGSRYRETLGGIACNVLPDMSVDDARVLAADTLHEMVGLRLKQIGLEVTLFGQAMGYAGNWGRSFVLGDSSTGKVSRLDDAVAERMAQVLFLEGAMKARFEALNAQRPSHSEAKSEGLRQQQRTPDAAITERQLLKTTHLGEMMYLAAKRKGITGPQFEQAAGNRPSDGRPYLYRNWLDKMQRERLDSQMDPVALHRVCDALELSDRARFHAIKLNKQLTQRTIAPSAPDATISEADILAAETVEMLLLLKLRQLGLHYSDLAEALEVSESTIGLLFTQGRTYQLDAEKLAGAVSEVLALNAAEREHLLALNAQLQPQSELRTKYSDESIQPHQLLTCTQLGQFLDMKLAQLGLSQRAYADRVGVTQMAISGMIVEELKNPLPDDRRDGYADALTLDARERLCWNWLNELKAKEFEALKPVASNGNALALFLGFAQMCHGEAINMQAVRDMLPLKSRPLLEAYLEIGFPPDTLRTLGQRWKLTPQQMEVGLAVNEAISRCGMQKTKAAKGEQKTLLDADDLYEALTIACERAKISFSALAASMGKFPDILTRQTSMEKLPGGALNRGLSAPQFQSVLTRLDIKDAEEIRYLKILNGCLWEVDRKAPFEWPVKQKSDDDQAQGTPTTTVGPGKGGHGKVKSGKREVGE